MFARGLGVANVGFSVSGFGFYMDLGLGPQDLAAEGFGLCCLSSESRGPRSPKPNLKPCNL